MIELYSSLSPSLNILFILISVFAIALQVLCLAIMTGKATDKLFEILLVFHLIIVSLMLRMINSGLGQSHIIIENYNILRYMIIFLIIVNGLYIYKNKRKNHILPGLLSIMITMPIMESLPYKMYTFLFLLSLLLILSRAGFHYLVKSKRLKNEITEYSIKEALDTQHSGILFAEKSGNILLINKQMLFLMKEITGKNFRNGEYFWNMLKEPYNSNDSHITDDIIRTSFDTENSCWQFLRKEIDYKGKKIYQIVATDVTEQEAINRRLELYGIKLKEQKDKLQEVLQNLEELRKEEAISRSWDYIHGVFGQNISIMQRLLSEEPLPDMERLSFLFENLLKGLDVTKEESIEENYIKMISAFKSLGIDLQIEGELPEDEGVASLFVEIIREGITNAIRHGQAEKVIIKISEDERHYLTIINKNESAIADIQWGGGLTAIDEKVREHRGSFEIRIDKDFTLLITLNPTTLSF